MKYNFEERGVEHIICSALNYKGDIICGRRHHNACEIFFRLYDKDVVDYDELIMGFMTSHDRFLNRRDAYVIANEQNQIFESHVEKEECTINWNGEESPSEEDMKQLISEDLY